MATIPLINQGSSYFAGSAIIDEINQLSEVAAIAPLTQTTRSITRWETSATGPTSDHNLLKNTPGVILSDAGDVNNFNSITFNTNVSIPSAGSLWLKTSDNHLYHGAVDLESGGGGDVTGGAVSAVNEICTYTDLTGKAIGRSGMNIKEDSFNVFATPGPIPTVSGGAQENVIVTATTIASPITNSSNTFYGAAPGFANASDFNTGIGAFALSSNSDPGGSNTAVGNRALKNATASVLSTAVGTQAGENMLTSTNNTLHGHRAGYSFESANSCVMVGTFAGGFELVTPVTGAVDCIFIGKQAGYATGILNGVQGCICIGPTSGTNITDNTFDIYLANSGVAGEDGVIRIGESGVHTKNFQSGIFGVTTDAVDAIPVLVSSTGQLGTVSSSIKYKENIKQIDYSDIIHKLNPVEFNYKSQPNHKSLGLIAEEVEKIYPEMCIYKNKGTPEQELFTVDYTRLNMLMLSEIQELRYEINTLKKAMRS